MENHHNEKINDISDSFSERLAVVFLLLVITSLK